VTEPVTRWTRTRRWLKRVTYQYVSVAGKHTLSKPPESLIRADLQLQPRTARWTHVLALKGPLFPEEPT
jgi:hypothetical protein